MLDFKSLSPNELDLVDNIVTLYEKAVRDGTPRPDLESELASIDNPKLIKGIRAELEHIDSFYENKAADKSNFSQKEFGDYVALDRVAVGGFATVFKGQAPDGSPVAIKVPHYTLHIGKTAQLEREAKILQLLCHENIVEFIDCGWNEGGDWYIVTEWIQGGNLGDAIHECEFSIDLTLHVMIQIATGIAFGHEQDIIHRDLKPRNIMLRDNQESIEVKILDYGLAKDQSADQTRSSHVRGTPDFMATEQLQGEADVRSDVYAMGRVAREMLRRRYPNRRFIPRPIRQIIDKATRRNPERRYQSVLEFKQALLNVKALNDAGQIPEFATPLVTWRRCAIAAMLTIAIAIAAWLHPVPPPTFDPDQPVASYFNSEGEARVLLSTSPATAKIYAYSLSTIKGPNDGEKILLGTGNVAAWLPPNDYLIVSIWPNGDFHEVIRRVPNPKNSEAHLDGVTSFTREVDGLRLKTIESPRNSKLTTRLRKGSFVEACDILEPEGARLPFVFETHSQSTPIWTLMPSDDTSLIVSPRGVYHYQRYFFLLEPNGNLDSTNEHMPEVDFIGIRSATPFGFPESSD